MLFNQQALSLTKFHDFEVGKSIKIGVNQHAD